MVEEFVFSEALTTKSIDVFNILKNIFLKDGMTLHMCMVQFVLRPPV